MNPIPFFSWFQIRLIFIVLCLGLVNAIQGSGQGAVKKIKEFPVEGVQKVSIDRLGNFYLVANSGSIKKYDTDGNFMSEFSSPTPISITLLEPWNPLRVFVYDRERQQMTILDRLLTLQEKIAVEPSLAVRPILASPTPNTNFWLLDEADFSFKKVDPKSTRVLQEMNLKITPGGQPDYTFLREYQNQLFLIDSKSGVEILSVTGKSIRRFPIKNLNYLGFLGQEIYYLENAKLKLFDLYSEEQREIAVDPLAEFVLLTDERMVVIKKSMVEVWEYKP